MSDCHLKCCDALAVVVQLIVSGPVSRALGWLCEHRVLCVLPSLPEYPNSSSALCNLSATLFVLPDLDDAQRGLGPAFPRSETNFVATGAQEGEPPFFSARHPLSDRNHHPFYATNNDSCSTATRCKRWDGVLIEVVRWTAID